MKDEFAAKVVKQIAPRLRAALRGPVRGLAATGRRMADGGEGDVDAVLLIGAPLSQRMRLCLEGGTVCNVFVENQGSVLRAIERGLKDHVVRLLAEATIIFDEEGDLHALQARASEAVACPRPESAAASLRAMCEPADLLRDLELRQNEPVVAQLLYGELLVALLRARLAAESCWAVPSPELLTANQRIDPPFAAWIAISTRRVFAAEMLPAIKRRVREVVERFDLAGDVVTAPAMAMAEHFVAVG